MLKIAISGKAGSGKNTAASLIAESILNLNKDEYKISAFAAKIKELTSSMFPGCSQESLYGPSELRQNKIESELDEITEVNATFRKVTLDLGKLGRSYSPYFWVAHVANEYAHLTAETKLYVIADLRFVEEFEWLKANEFLICRVKRNNLIKVNDISETAQDELSDDMFDLVIDNNGSVDELKKQLSQSLDKLFHNNKTYLQVRDANR